MGNVKIMLIGSNIIP